MPYPAGHSAAVKVRIVESARRLFNRHGFENVSLDQIMSGAGLTRGGFYNHFQSKSDLYAEVLGCFFTDPNWKNRWEGVEINMNSNAGPQVICAYLSDQHFEDVENSCPMVALPTDVTRSNESTRRAFETAFRAMVRLMEHSIAENGAEDGESGETQERHNKAQAISAMCIGGMVVARALADRSLADELRDGCMRVALELGGWRTEAVSSPLS